MHTIKYDNRGFTLLEVVIAISVLGIGILAMGVLQTTTVRLNNSAKGITEASAWASDTMEKIMALAYTDDDIDEDTYTTADDNKVLPNDHPAIAQGYTIIYSVADNGPVLNGDVTYKTITVTVNWSSLGTFGSNRNVTLSFIKPRLI